jgi:anthranilate/para-aminobenzoate synthase component I
LRTVFSADNYFNIPIGVGIVSGSRVDEEVAEIYAKLRLC